ncbi:hypothetical protein WA026_007342 [Henosepilachna vigintioctopunctata]|uniref:Acyltransferase n=1 Tax=Henosepilachna vigintioctopunctata TaxID=420089 RepID=A0AAW1ULL7_9CUCU
MQIEFAPLHIPMERRIQMTAIIAYAFLVGFGGFSVIALSIYFLLYTTYCRWIYLAYLLWIYFYDIDSCETGGRQVMWVKKWKWWWHMANYFPIKLYKVPFGDLDPKRNYLFCCFPHGMISTGAFTVFLTEARNISKSFPNHKVHMNTLRTNFFVPILRELTLSIGGISSSKRSLNYILSKPDGGNITALVIGGAQEAFYNKPGHYILVLKNRKGFVKVALQNGSPLVPVMSFGEPDIISQVEFKDGSLFQRFQLFIKKCFGFVPLVPLGRGIFQYNYGILPQRVPINVVVGRPIDVEKVEQPTQEQIDDLHERFIKELDTLFEKQKKKFIENADNVHLEII